MMARLYLYQLITPLINLKTNNKNVVRVEPPLTTLSGSAQIGGGSVVFLFLPLVCMGPAFGPCFVSH